MRFGRKDKDMERKEEKRYEIPMEMTAETAADFGIAPGELRPIRVGVRHARGIFVSVTKEVYDAYMRPLWRETKREERHEAAFSLDLARDEYAMETPADIDVARDAERAEREAAVQSAMGLLSERDRKILFLFADGFSMADIARQIGMSERGVRYRKEAAFGKLRGLLAAYGEDVS